MTVNSLGPECCWCCVALGERDGELDPDHAHIVGDCDWCDGPGRAFNPMPIMVAITDEHGRAGVRVLVEVPELGIAAGSEFLTLKADPMSRVEGEGCRDAAIAVQYTLNAWDCPECGSVNVTDVELGGLEQCGHCGEDVEVAR